MTDDELIVAMAKAASFEYARQHHTSRPSIYQMQDVIKAAFEVCRPEIEALRAENARLLAALKPFADKAELYSEWAGTARDAIWFPISDLRAARAAMGESDE